MAKTGPRKTYPLDQCPLYKLRSRQRLARLFDRSLSDLESLARRRDNYRQFTLAKDGRKGRLVEVPKPQLERIHRRLFELLSRVEPPHYLHSGVRGRSYVTNAKVHIGAGRLFKLDIKKFFPSTKSWHVSEFYRAVLKCSADVADLLTALSTCSGHVPTGSCLSQVLAFYSHISAFEAIAELAGSLGLRVTVYVDDIAISGDAATRSTLYKVRGILRSRSLESPARKERVYDADRPKEVTGTIVTTDRLLLPNAKHKQIHEEMIAAFALADSAEKLELVSRVTDRLLAASQVDPSLRVRAEMMLDERRRLTRKV